MNQQLKKLYLLTARNSDFITQRALSKYMPLKNDLVNYDSIFELNQNLREVEIAFNPNPKKTLHKEKTLERNDSDVRLSKMVKRKSKKSPIRAQSLIDVYNHEKSKISMKKMKSNQKPIQNNSITIIENDDNPQMQTLQETQRQEVKKSSKQKLSNHQHNKFHSIEVNQLQLDSYIDQYLRQLMDEKKVNIKKQIESDRKLFIQKAILSLKSKIRQENRHQQINNREPISQNLQNGLARNDFGQTRSYQVHVKSNSEQDDSLNQKSRIQKKLEIGQKRIKEKRKCKSTQLIPLSVKKQSQKISSKQQPMLPSIKSGASSQLASIGHRSIYSNTPGASFINKVGKTFYLNELNVLNKTLELEAKNRERAQRVFRRKLINIEKQQEKIARNNCEQLGN